MGLREKKKEKMRKAIIDAARKLFKRNGYHATPLREICEMCDIVMPTLFRYFPSKAVLYIETLGAKFDAKDALCEVAGVEAAKLILERLGHRVPK